jgi:hypothetical protein
VNIACCQVGVLCIGLITKFCKGRPWLGIASKDHSKEKKWPFK